MNLINSTSQADIRILEKLSTLVTLISFYPDMHDHIIKLDLLKFVTKIINNKFTSSIISNGVLAISLMTYNQRLFNEIIGGGVIDMILRLCRDRSLEIEVKEQSTLSLVHFALYDTSIKILIEKGVLELFDEFKISSCDEIASFEI